MSLTMATGWFKDLIAEAIANGVPKEVFAYILILPLLAGLIAAARHLLGLTTHGTFIPAVISLVWVQTGIYLGLLVFSFLMLCSFIVRYLIKKTMISRFKINYLPRMAILLMLLSLGLLVLALMPGWSWIFTKEMIFAFLVLILVIHNLIEIQINLSKKESREVIIETIAFALIGYGLLVWTGLRDLVLTYPGLTLLVNLLINILVGRYVGFRFLEYYRFKSIVD